LTVDMPRITVAGSPGVTTLQGSRPLLFGFAPAVLDLHEFRFGCNLAVKERFDLAFIYLGATG
jgi:hypothetical protein